MGYEVSYNLWKDRARCCKKTIIQCNFYLGIYVTLNNAKRQPVKFTAKQYWSLPYVNQLAEQ